MKNLGLILVLALVSVSAFAEEGTMAGEGATYLKSFGYFIAMGLAALGGTIGQSRAAAAALDGIARNPNAADKIFTPMLLALAFMESLVIFTLISTFLG